MNRGKYILLTILILLLAFIEKVNKNTHSPYSQTLPLFKPNPEIAKILSFGASGLLSDIIFFKTIVFYGGVNYRKLSYPELSWMYDMLKTATRLDPYSTDAYFFSQAEFTWGRTGWVPQLNKLLLYGTKYNKIWTLYYFLGFNTFYFLKDTADAAEYFKKAAMLNPKSAFLKRITAKMFYESGREEMAIAYLSSMLSATRKPYMRKEIQTRLTALKRAFYLKKEVLKFRREQGRMPGDLDELVKMGYIRQIPKDPYGGKFYLKGNKIWTTSNFYWRPNANHKD